MYYILDTNIWVDAGKGVVRCDDLKKKDLEVALAPFSITELVRGVVKGGEKWFAENKSTFDCMARVGSSILDLPRNVIFSTIWSMGLKKNGAT
jgi:hypothetical protein